MGLVINFDKNYVRLEKKKYENWVELEENSLKISRA